MFGSRGCDNRKLLAVACDRLCGEIDVDKELKKVGNTGKSHSKVSQIAALFV